MRNQKSEMLRPKAYLNNVMYDDNFQPIMDPAQTNYVQVTENAKESGRNGDHERLYAEVEVQRAGYMYIYLSNDNYELLGEQVDVFFDDFQIQQVHSKVVQSDDYYPFGLTFNSYKRENSVENRIKIQGQEHIDALGLNWDSFKWRNHQPDIGRFFNVDPLAEKYYYNSPYAFSENRVIDGRELEGLEWKSIKSENPDGSRKVQFQLTLTVKNSSSMSASEAALVAESIAAQIESSFQGHDEESNTTYSTSVLLVFGGDKGDMTLEFVNEGNVLNRDTQQPYPVSFGIQGAVNQKDGDSQQNRIQVQTSADDVTKTGAHEAGHTAGLADPKASDKSKDTNGLPLGEGNLMNQEMQRVQKSMPPN